MNENVLKVIGWAASVAAVLMFFSYIDQISLNLNGKKGSSLQPLATVVNCLLWITYGFAKKYKDWPIIVANFPGVLLGIVAFVTSF